LVELSHLFSTKQIPLDKKNPIFTRPKPRKTCIHLAVEVARNKNPNPHVLYDFLGWSGG